MKKPLPQLVIYLTFICTTLLANDSWKQNVPVPIFEKTPQLVDLYWTAWEQAYDHLKKQEGLAQSPYMDEAFWDDTIWIWDTCFMTLFCKYSPEDFPGVESLNNFYVPLHGTSIQDGSFPLNIQHPDNPPLFAWVEYDNYSFSNDSEHLDKLLNQTQYLQKHFDWFNTVPRGWKLKSNAQRRKQSRPIVLQKLENGYLWNGVSSGMDNTPRKGGLWIDAIAQQGLSALYISRLAEKSGNSKLASEWKAKYEKIKATVNKYYWDEEDGIYYDIKPHSNEFLKVKTPASYWPMLAEMCSPKQAEKMLQHIQDPDTFGGERPWVTVARNDPAFTAPDGDYWRGGIWLPTAYMATKALEKYGFYEDADKAAENLLMQMLRTYNNYKPQTIWECYSPTADRPADHKGKQVRPDFCGWSALGPISLFIENVLGFHVVDAQEKRIEWRLYQEGQHGIKKLKFGDITTDLLYDGRHTVTIKSNQPYTLIINQQKHRIQKGITLIKVP
jgi:hypothetical protein